MTRGTGVLGEGEAGEVHPHEGLRLGRYELLVPIATGGMAEVWAARLLGNLGFSRIVAMKTILPEFAEDPSFRKGFFDEARIAARLGHANLVEVIDFGEEGPILFQVMTLIEGDSAAMLVKIHNDRLRVHERPRGLPPAMAIRIAIDMLAGLHAAHELTNEQGVRLELVHRDVSPQNVLVGIDGVARLADFGVAKALGRCIDETEVGQVRGKPGYLAPEQITRQPLDRRTDVFAAGIVIWELMTGQPLFRAEIGVRPFASIRDDRFPDPREFMKEDLPAPIAAGVVMRALERDPNKRFQSAEEMMHALWEAAKAQGLSAPARDLAAFVRELSGERVEWMRQSIRNALLRETDRSGS